MAKHNKWSKIKHRKAVVDKRRGRVWTKISKAITVAARHAGPDPSSNLTLRYAMDEARYANMPRDTVERAIQKGAGGGDMSTYEQVRYEGYAPGGVAVIIDALTDNRTRTVMLLRTAFSEHDGNLGATGCVAYMFQTRGQIVLAGAGMLEERVMEAALAAGALDVQDASEDGEEDTHEKTFVILCEVAQYIGVKDALEKAGFPITQASITMIPQTMASVTVAQAKVIDSLVEALEEIDDVQKVYVNAEE